MPIIRKSITTPRFIEPETTTEIARYINLEKFLSLVINKQIFFCRTDKLEDKYEGTLPKLSKSILIKWYKHMRDNENYFTIPMPDNKIEEIVSESIEFRNKLKAITCVNCWNEYNGESYALWKIYSKLDQGLMIKSTYQNLINSFTNSDEVIFCSKINYIDYEKDRFDIGDIFAPFVNKYIGYSFESEIRLIHQTPDQNYEYDWNKEKCVKGKMINVNLNELINEVVISPQADNNFLKLINEIKLEHKLSYKISRSNLKF